MAALLMKYLHIACILQKDAVLKFFCFVGLWDCGIVGLWCQTCAGKPMQGKGGVRTPGWNKFKEV
jgi:hypothetical protein